MNTVIDKPVPDFAAIKQRQQAPGGSGDYAVVGTTLQIVGETLVEAGDVRADERVLDVAAGNGNVSLAAARRFARVTSTDYVQALLDKGGAPALEPLSYLPVVLEQLDYGVVVLDATSRRALHVNQAAKDQLGPNGLLQLVDGVLATRLPSDRLTLLSALNEAAHRGLRRLVRIGGDARRIWISILPLHPGLELPGPVLRTDQSVDGRRDSRSSGSLHRRDAEGDRAQAERRHHHRPDSRLADPDEDGGREHPGHRRRGCILAALERDPSDNLKTLVGTDRTA